MTAHDPELSARSAPASRHAGAWIAVLLALAWTIPVWLPPVLPLTDLGGHIGRFAVQIDGGKDPQLAQWYSFDWHLVPNLGADILVQLFAPLFGIEPTVRGIVALAVFMQALGMLLTARAVHGRITPFALLALPVVYGHSFTYGFLNYFLSLGLVWCSLPLWLALGREPHPGLRRWLVFALVATLVWVCHLVGWALLCIVIGAQEFTRQLARRKDLVSAAAASIAPLSCLLVPWLFKLVLFPAATGSGDSSGFLWWAAKLAALLRVLRDRSPTFDTLSIECLAIVIVWGLVSRWTKLDRGLALAGLVTAICFVIVPDRLLGSYFADQRLLEPMVEFLLLSIGFAALAPMTVRRIALALAALFAGSRLVTTGASMWQLGSNSARQLAVLDHVPRNAQLIFFRTVGCPANGAWLIDRDRHLGGYAIARRHAFSNDQWQLPGAQLLKVHNPAAGPFMADETQIVFAEPCGGMPGVMDKIDRIPEAIGYLWVSWHESPRKLDDWEPVAAGGESILYRRKPAP